jgi:hypothetical protein
VFADGFVYSFGVMITELLRHFQGGHSLTSWIVSALLGLTLGIGRVGAVFVCDYTFGCRSDRECHHQPVRLPCHHHCGCVDCVVRLCH